MVKLLMYLIVVWDIITQLYHDIHSSLSRRTRDLIGTIVGMTIFFIGWIFFTWAIEIDCGWSSVWRCLVGIVLGIVGVVIVSQWGVAYCQLTYKLARERLEKNRSE